MLKFAFWTLLFVNAGLFAYGQGYFGSGAGNDHEPARLKRQFNTPKLTLLTGEQAAVAAKAAPAPAGGDEAAAAQAEPPAPAPPAPAVVPAAVPAATAARAALACLDVGALSAGDARRFEARLAALDLGGQVQEGRKTVQAQDVTSWLVNVPPQPTREAAERKVAELRNLGVSDLFIMNGDSPMKNAISLGAFKTESGAQALLAQLNKQGVHTARITARGPQTTHYTYRLRGLDEATRKRIVGYAERYDAETRACRP